MFCGITSGDLLFNSMFVGAMPDDADFSGEWTIWPNRIPDGKGPIHGHDGATIFCGTSGDSFFNSSVFVGSMTDADFPGDRINGRVGVSHGGKIGGKIKDSTRPKKQVIWNSKIGSKKNLSLKKFILLIFVYCGFYRKVFRLYTCRHIVTECMLMRF